MELNDINLEKDLKAVPELNGNPTVLPRFIKICDEIVSKYSKSNDELLKTCVIDGILKKITGNAAENWLQLDPFLEPDWDKIKNDLIQNFTGLRDEANLCAYLVLNTQGNSSPREFYNSCNYIFSTLMTYVKLHEKHSMVIEAKQKLYTKLTLDSFLRGLKDPLGSNVRCMRPDTIETALKFVNEEITARELRHPGNITVPSWPWGISRSTNAITQYKQPGSSNQTLFGSTSASTAKNKLEFGYGNQPQSTQAFGFGIQPQSTQAFGFGIQPQSTQAVTSQPLNVPTAGKEK